MKKTIITILLIAFNITSSAFAIDDRKMISDSEKQSELINSFNEVNAFTDGLFYQKNTMQKMIDKQKEKELLGREELAQGNNLIRKPKTLTPVKRIRLHLKEKSEKSVKELKEEHLKEAEENTMPANEQVILDCDYMEYFTERTELEATGNVSMRFPQNDTVLTADKMIYNQTTNKITAVGHVVIIKDKTKMEGDYLVVNMNEENAILENPETQFAQINARSKIGYMYGEDVIQEQGSIYITKKTMVNFRSDVYGPLLENMIIPEQERSSLTEDSFGSKLKLKVSDIIINSKKEHDNITVKKADIYFNNKKIGFIPAMTIHMNKNHDYTIIDNPELGTMTDLGMYVGPGFVFDTPHGTALKLIPFFNYQGSDDDDASLGVGAFAKFRAATNKTDVAFGTANKVLLVDGVQYLDDNLFFQYGANRYLDDWFLGQRKARMMGELVYQDSIIHRNFLAKKRDMTFSHRFSAGYMQDGPNDSDIGLFGEEGIGTFRTKYMAEINQNIFKINDPAKDPINAKFDIVGQGSFALYGTGDTQSIVRIGPRFHHQYKRWMSDIGYFLSGYSDGSPLRYYDAYVYGGSNVYLRESIRLSKYLTFSWLGSLNLSYEDEKYRNSNIKMLPENSFFFAIGPDDCRLHIGYDAARQQSYVYMTMNLDAKGTVVDYDKMIVKNLDNMQEKKKEILYVNNIPDDKYQKTKIPPLPKFEKAEVTDIIYDERL